MRIAMSQPTKPLFIYLLTIHSPHPTMARQPLIGQGLHNIEASDTPHSVGPLWTSDWPLAETSDNSQHSQKTDIHAPGGIRTRSSNKGAAADRKACEIGLRFFRR